MSKLDRCIMAYKTLTYYETESLYISGLTCYVHPGGLTLITQCNLARSFFSTIYPNYFLKKKFSVIPSDCQTVGIQMWPDKGRA